MDAQCGKGEKPDRVERLKVVAATLRRIRNKILVLSGKGGVGKSTVAANLALALVQRGRRVGLLDIDVHGPSIPAMLGLDGARPGGTEHGIEPVSVHGLKVMSIGFLLEGADTPVIWRGPMKMGAIEQLLAETQWGDLDDLVVDCPPGTGDEPLSIAQLVPDAKALVVTTPQRIATLDVRKSIAFCRQVGLDVLGVVENMNGVVCPHCGGRVEVFPSGGAERMCKEMGVPLLASLPMDPAVARDADSGIALTAHASPPVRAAMQALVEAVLERTGNAQFPTGAADAGAGDGEGNKTKEKTMRIAIPVAGGRLCAHFGHCEVFAFLDVDQGSRQVVGRQDLTPPPHEPGVIPGWVAAQGAKVVLAGGMGARAVSLFEQAGVQVFTGCPAETPEALVQGFLDGRMVRGGNACDEGGHHCG